MVLEGIRHVWSLGVGNKETKAGRVLDTSAWQNPHGKSFLLPAVYSFISNVFLISKLSSILKAEVCFKFARESLLCEVPDHLLFSSCLQRKGDSRFRTSNSFQLLNIEEAMVLPLCGYNYDENCSYKARSCLWT